MSTTMAREFFREEVLERRSQRTFEKRLANCLPKICIAKGHEIIPEILSDGRC